MSLPAWLQDRDGAASFTRVAPALCLAVALGAWSLGMVRPDLQEYCKTVADKLVEFAKWAFCVGKTAEQFRDIGKKEPV